MTNQTAEFDKYISDTKKMRAYQGSITGELTGMHESDARAGNAAQSPEVSLDAPYIAPALARRVRGLSSTTTMRGTAHEPTPGNTVHIAVVVTLAILALVLAVYLLAK
jgi:hypothetical protein